MDDMQIYWPDYLGGVSASDLIASEARLVLAAIRHEIVSAEPPGPRRPAPKYVTTLILRQSHRGKPFLKLVNACPAPVMPALRPPLPRRSPLT